MNDITKLLDNIKNDDKTAAADVFNNLMRDKVSADIDIKTVEAATKVFNSDDD